MYFTIHLIKCDTTNKIKKIVYIKFYDRLILREK